MKKYEPGDTVPYGFYVSFRPMDARFVGASDETLDGKAGACYRRVPTWLFLLASPVIGGAFVLLFPLIVVSAVVYGFSVWLPGVVVGHHAYATNGNAQPGAARLQAGAGQATGARNGGAAEDSAKHGPEAPPDGK